jgi:uncharacterized membrane protein
MNFEFLRITSPARFLFLGHALFGLVALLTFGIPYSTRKGGRAHRITGKIYVASMIISCILTWFTSGWKLSYENALQHPNFLFMVFLFLISFFTLDQLHLGLKVLHHKNRTEPAPIIQSVLTPTVAFLMALVATPLVEYTPLIRLIGSGFRWQ